MDKELDQEVIKSTQIALGKYVKRPPLSEKLLKKPPFRFLHDIITTVLKTTGFFDKLFDEDELISDNVKDRESKISFLNKVIFVVSSTTGKSLTVKPSKIVSGQEPEKTNELLQCLAQALDGKLSSDKAVKQYKEGIKSTQVSETKTKEPNKITKKSNDVKKSTSSHKNDATRSTSKQDKEKNSDIKSKRKENISNKGEVQAQRTQPTKTTIRKHTKEPKESQKDDHTQSRLKINHNVIENEISAIKKETSPNPLNKVDSQESNVSLEKDMDEQLNVNVLDSRSVVQTDHEKLNSSYTINESDLNSSASSNDLLETPHNKTSENKILGSDTTKESSATNIENIIDHGEADGLKSLNYNFNEQDTNVPKNNKSSIDVVNKETESKIIEHTTIELETAAKTSITNDNDTKISRPATVRPASVRPSSSRPGAPRMREKVDNVLKDTDNLLMAKVNIIVENTNNEEDEDASLLLMDQSETTLASQEQQELQLSSSEHGHLVQQILDSQKELSQVSGKTEIEWQFGAQKAREAMNQDVEQLRFNIQALSRVANPLGKLLDHIQEDVEVMRQELQQWSNIYEDVNKEMLKQKSVNEDSMMPFHTKLRQLDSDIEEKHNKIDDLKILIHKNTSRIEKLLISGNVQ